MIARALRARPRSAAAVGLVLALTTFGLYCSTFGDLAGYSDETAAVAEGLVVHGDLQILPRTPMTSQGIWRNGHRYGRAGIVQPLLEAPFYAIGYELDGLASDHRNYSWRQTFVRFYDPLMAALTVLAIYGLLLLRGCAMRRAVLVAGLAAIGSLVWPYSKLGMETTLMAMFSLALLACAWAVRGDSLRRWWLAGVAAGATVASMPYGAVLLAGCLPFLLREIAHGPRRRGVAMLTAFGASVLVSLALIGWYNAYRTGSVTNFDDTYPLSVLSAPISAIGLYLSPGKGLLFYSPLVIVGLAGMRDLWREDRLLAQVILAGVLANTVVIAIKLGWSDETWGPRYMVPSVWLLLLPIAWWPRGRRRRRALFATASLAVAVQVSSVFTAYDTTITLARTYSGTPAFSHTPYTHVPYGDDGQRWVPGASPLLFQGEVVLAWLMREFTGNGFVVGYHPRLGYGATIDLRDPERRLHTFLPYFWWTFPNVPIKQRLLGTAFVLMALCGGWLLAMSPALAVSLPAARPRPAPTRP
jgi:hypothetical protein